MQAGKRNIKQGFEYDRFFPKSELTTEVIKRNSKLEDTIAFLPEAILKTLHQTKLIAAHLKGSKTYETCKKIWHWVFNHIQYEKDEKGKEQIRSPQRTWHDRNWQNEPDKGCDCDDYTVLISSMLCNLKIAHELRIAKYSEKDGYQHIYPVVLLPSGEEIIMDCVVDRFNYEVPPIQQINQAMELQFLNGLPSDTNRKAIKASRSIDAEDLIGDEEIGDLGRRKLSETKIFQRAKTAVNKTVAVVNKTLHAVNKVNPATALLRLGILASLKLNILKVAQQLRYAYLTPDQAAQRGFDAGRFSRLVGVKEKLEKIFFTAGGTPEHFKEAILKGHGNRNHDVQVAGLGRVDFPSFSESHSLSQILGINAYQTEIETVEGLGSLGDPATGAAIAAATSALTAIAAILKSIGSLKKNKDAKAGTASDGSTDTTTDTATTNTATDTNSTTDNTDTTATSDESKGKDSTTKPTAQPAKTTVAAGGANNSDTPAGDKSETGAGDDTSSTADSSSNERSGANAKTTPSDSWWDKFKNWVNDNKPLAIGLGVGAVALIGFAGYKIYQSSQEKKEEKEEEKKKSDEVHGLSGKGAKKKKKKSGIHYPTSLKIHKLR